MKRLTAQRPILYGGRMYQAGDTLPAYDKRMVQAWLSAESAKMTDDAAEEATMPPQDADGGQDGTENADTTQDTHTVNGKEMAAVVDDNELLERDKAKIMAAQTEGTYKARRLVYVAKADFGPRPAQGAMLTLDGKAYKVKSCTEEAGVLAIELEAVRS